MSSDAARVCAEAPDEATYRPLAGESAGSGNFPLRQTSSRILRTASMTLSGGAAIVPPALDEEEGRGDGGGARPERSTSVPRLRSTLTNDVGPGQALRNQQVQQLIVEDLSRRMRHIAPLACLVGVGMVIVLILLILWIRALWATLSDWGLPCDEPLKYYMPTGMLASFVGRNMLKTVSPSRLRPRWAVLAGIASALPGWVVLGWGVHMMRSSRTCSTTNPVLFTALWWYICFQVLSMVLCSVLLSVGFVAVRWWLISLFADKTRGCEKAVHSLPKVPADSEELVDHSEGEVQDCPICTETLGSAEHPVVRTYCGHYYHEACLAQWCKGHDNCPLCREKVGEPDGSP